MKSNRVVLFYPTGSNPASSSVNATVALPSIERRVDTASRSSSARTSEKRGLAALHNDWRQDQFWETMIFATLGMCGVASMVLALLSITAGH